MNSELYHGDFHDFDITADVVITEPLYFGNGMGQHSARFNITNADNYESYLQDIIDTVSSPVMAFLQPDYRDIPDVFDGWIVSEIRTGNIKDFLVSNIGESKTYSGPGNSRNPRPYEVMREIVEDFSKEGHTVYDPFMGFGSTGVACEGRRFIGVEIEDRFFDIAKKRIGDVV